MWAKLNRCMWYVYRIALILSLFLAAGCSAAVQIVNTEPAVGELFALTNSATSLHVIKTLAGGGSSFILQNGDKFMFFWPLREGQGVAFWGLDLSTMKLMLTKQEMLRFVSGMSGQIGNCLETACLVDWMKSNGWKVVGASELTLAVKDAILVIATTPTKCLPTFVILPSSSSDQIFNLFPEPVSE